MNSADPAPAGIMEAEVKLWFTRWLTEKQVDVNPVNVIEADSIKLEAALTSEDVQISEKFRKTVLSQFQAEAQISEAQLSQALQLKTAVDRVDPTILEQEDWVDFPFSTIIGEEAKLISKVNSTLGQNDFSTMSMKSWRIKFTRIFDSSFVTGRLARLAIIWNTCSDSTKNRILSMGIGERAGSEDFKFTDLLRIICILYGSPSHSEVALQSIYSGVAQAQNESIPVYLERIRCLGEDGFGPAVRWTLNNALKIVQTVISGLRSKPLSQLVAGYMISIPFQFHMFQDTVLQFHTRIPSQHPLANSNQVNVLDNERPIRCFRCDGGHYVKECPIKMCRKCSGQHDVRECNMPKEKLVCTKCSIRGHTTKAHYGPVTKKVSTNILEPAEVSSSVFTCSPGNAATSFLDGTVNIGQTGNSSFVYCPRILIDTGALVPSGIAISDVFFKDHLGGDISRLTPSYLKSANGATDNATMTTLGEVSMQLKFSRINMIFKGQAVVLENLSLPIILGVNFLKHNSLSPFLTPQLAQLVHTPSLQTQDLIANVGENKFKPPPPLAPDPNIGLNGQQVGKFLVLEINPPRPLFFRIS